MHVARGFADAERPLIARLFWQAFSGKLGRIMAPEPRALSFLEGALHPDFAIVARDRRGRLLGAAGIKTRAGGLVVGGFGDLARAYGPLGALWRAPLLEMTERRIAADALILDGLFVAEQARRRGVGTHLVRAVLEEAAERRCVEVRLDVVDGNDRARALYERLGFRPVAPRPMGLAGAALGVRAATTMARPVAPLIAPAGCAPSD
ncbi:GNAT family N-acetyltransferase [Rhodovulum sp. 12E13]|nr:GNAT family N-acetyltransferase [Rhodovulum sp. 12E13]